MFAHFIDGADMSISSFDKKKTDKGYAAVLENTKNDMASINRNGNEIIMFLG